MQRGNQNHTALLDPQKILLLAFDNLTLVES